MLIFPFFSRSDHGRRDSPRPLCTLTHTLPPIRRHITQNNFFVDLFSLWLSGSRFLPLKRVRYRRRWRRLLLLLLCKNQCVTVAATAPVHKYLTVYVPLSRRLNIILTHTHICRRTSRNPCNILFRSSFVCVCVWLTRKHKEQSCFSFIQYLIQSPLVGFNVLLYRYLCFDFLCSQRLSLVHQCLSSDAHCCRLCVGVCACFFVSCG